MPDSHPLLRYGATVHPGAVSTDKLHLLPSPTRLVALRNTRVAKVIVEGAE